MKDKLYKVIVDRPIGHVDSFGNKYPINYGYIPGIMAGDGEEQDVYIMLKEDLPLKIFKGKLIAKIIRKDDVEEKWVLGEEGCNYTKEEIEKSVSFLEKYFDSYTKTL